jgi:lambda family phage tail tape measure protein
LHELAGAQAASAEKTRNMTEAMDFAKDATKGFFDDIRQGVEDGKSALEIFGNAFLNILDKLASKLLEMAIMDMFTGGNSAGGFGSALVGLVGGLFGGGGGGSLFANGGAFNRGNVIPFATGGIVDRPTVFPFARGVGLMGEAGPEAIMPLRRGRGGRLGVETGGGGGAQPVVVYVTGDTDLVRVTANDVAVKVVTAAAPKIEGSAVSKATRAVPSAVAIDHAERGGDYRT